MTKLVRVEVSMQVLTARGWLLPSLLVHEMGAGAVSEGPGPRGSLQPSAKGTLTLTQGPLPPRQTHRHVRRHRNTHTCMHTDDLCPATAGTSGKEEGLGETSSRGEEPVGASKVESPFENSGSRDTGSCRDLRT